MNYQVPTTTILAMVFTLLISLGVPLLACVWAKKRFKEAVSLNSLVIGAAAFFVFAMVLERVLHSVVFVLAGTVIQENIWLYAIYGGLAAGVFEETGRFVAMKFFMKRNLTRENSLMYGIGHGGIESIMLVGMTYISNLVVAFTINGGGLKEVLDTMDAATKEATIQGLAPLWELPALQFAAAGVERVCAFVLQIALSYLVYTAVKYGKKQFYLLAILLHASVNAIAVLLAQVLPVLVVEAVLIVMVALVALFVRKLYREENTDFSKLQNTP